jgi:hypothetical protein
LCIINSTSYKQGLPQPQKELAAVPISKHKNIQQKLSRQITVINHIQNFIQHHSVKVHSICGKKSLVIIGMDFDVSDQLLIRYSSLI